PDFRLPTPDLRLPALMARRHWLGYHNGSAVQSRLLTRFHLMSSRTPLSRRRFLQTTATASTVFAAPYFIPARAFGANERVNLGFIGCKNRGMQNMEGFTIVGKDAGKLTT